MNHPNENQKCNFSTRIPEKPNILPQEESSGNQTPSTTMAAAARPAAILPVLPRDDDQAGNEIYTAYLEARAVAHKAARLVVTTGLMLIEASKRAKHGDFGRWLKAYCPHIPERTAYRWMQTATDALGLPGIVDRIKSLPAGVTPAQLLLSDPSRISDDHRAIQQDFFAILDGKTQREITFGWSKPDPQPKKYHPPVHTPAQLAQIERDSAEEILSILTDKISAITNQEIALVSDKTRKALREACIGLAHRLKA